MDQTRVLADGSRLLVRPILPSDAGELRRGFHSLSQSSRYQRFLGQLAELTPSMLSYLTNVDGHDHVALVALRLDTEEREHELVAVARLIRTEPGGRTAEVAITVADAWQGRGLGKCIMHELLEVPLSPPVTQLLAHALPSNVAVRALLRSHGSLREVDGVITVQRPLAPHGLARVVAKVSSWPGFSRRRAA